MADAHAPYHPLMFQFVGALLQRTLTCRTAAAHQQALRGFLDELTPWISSADLPPLLRQPFILLDHLAFTPNGVDGDEDLWVARSAEGQVVFRAWLHQRGLDPVVCSSSGDDRMLTAPRDLTLECSQRDPQAPLVLADGTTLSEALQQIDQDDGTLADGRTRAHEPAGCTVWQAALPRMEDGECPPAESEAVR